MSHITFDYGGWYSVNEDKKEWYSREHNVYALHNVGGEGFSYDILTNKILRKMKANPSTVLRFSHYAYGIHPKRVSYIVDDEDVLGFLNICEKFENRPLLHVEVVTKELASDNRAKESEVAENDPKEPCEAPEQCVAPEQCEEAVEHFEEALEHCEGLDIVPCSPAGNISRGNISGYEGADVAEQVDVVDLAWDDGIDIVVGQIFESKRAVQDIVDRAIHRYCFDVITERSSTLLLVLKCRGNDCKWSLRVARRKGCENWTVRTYKKIHTCSRVTTSTSRYKKKGTPRLVAFVIHDDYPGRFDTPSAKMLVSLVQRKLGVKVSYETALRGKKLAINDVRGSSAESFRMLPSYLHMLEKKNDGTITRIEVDEQQRFKYMFFALGASIEGFFAMRKVIIIDATFLKNEYGGVLIIATAQDPDHHHYPLAFGVADGENDDSWRWFLQMLKSCVPDSPGLVIVSDRNSSIIKTVSEVYPNAKHGYCIWHLSQNVKSHVSGVNKEVVAQRFRECAQVYTETEFFEKYTSFKMTYPQAGEYLDKSVIELKWARCFFPGERYNIDTTNCAESLNAIFKTARNYSLLPMIDLIVEKIAEWFNKHRRTAEEISMEHKLVPYVANVLHSRCEFAKLLDPKELNGYTGEYCVTARNGKVYFVDLDNKTCSCKHFDIDRYPCEHAIAAVMYRTKTSNVDLYMYCSHYYSIEQWALAYYMTIYPVPHISEWAVPEDVARMRVLPPPYKRRKGRRQETRFPSVAEPRKKRKSSGPGRTSEV